MKIFVARDHNYANKQFGDVKENEKITVRIIGKRFELNDPYIVAIAALVDSGRRDPRSERNTKKPKITVLEDEASNLEDEDEYVEPEPESEEPLDKEEQAPISIPTVRNPVPNGTSFDGTSFNGASLNGTSLEEGEISE
jgi:hypothetical protein